MIFENLWPLLGQRLGWRSHRKLLVIESDDWGALYLPNKPRLEKLRAAGITNAFDNGYDSLDCLECMDDLEKLMNVLASFNDCRGRSSNFTFNTVMGNPNFVKIQESDFEEYHHQNFFDSYLEYQGEDLREVWHHSTAEKLITPQFHAREHLNVRLWMNDLRHQREDTRIAFDNRFFALRRSPTPPRSYSAAYWPFSSEHLHEICDITIDGLKMFEREFGYPSSTFVACNFVLPAEVERVTAQYGVKMIQTQRRHRTPTPTNPNAKRSRIGGWKNKFGQVYSIRNVMFEPFESPDRDWASSAFAQTEMAFRQKKPAVVCSHRVNYVGGQNSNIRDKNLRQLESFLRKVVSRFPEIEFISSDELLEIMLSPNRPSVTGKTNR